MTLSSLSSPLSTERTGHSIRLEAMTREPSRLESSIHTSLSQTTSFTLAGCFPLSPSRREILRSRVTCSARQTRWPLFCSARTPRRLHLFGAAVDAFVVGAGWLLEDLHAACTPELVQLVLGGATQNMGLDVAGAEIHWLFGLGGIARRGRPRRSRAAGLIGRRQS